MSDDSPNVKKRIELSTACAERLNVIAQKHRMDESIIIESALNVLFNIVEDLDTQTESRGWMILPERLLPRGWSSSGTDMSSLSSRRSMSYDEFLEWADQDTLTEWVDGEVIIATSSSDKDVVIREFLHNVLRIFVSVNKQGLIRMARFQMKLARSGREPDLLFVTTEHLDRLKSNYLDGPADVVVEISCPEHIGRDRGEKFYEYEQAGIPEYWLIDPDRKWAEFYVLGESGHYQANVSGAEGVFQSLVIKGFWCRIEWLWKPPPILQALRELGIITPEV